MTARSSATKPDFLRYFSYKFKSLKSFLILNSVFAFLSYPALAIVGIFYVNARNNFYILPEALRYENGAPEFKAYHLWQNIFNMFIPVTVVALIGLFFMALPILMKNFRYLYDKRYVDMDISLPVSDNTRFFGDFLSGIFAYTIPHALAIALGALIVTICPPIYDVSKHTYYPVTEVTSGEIAFINLFLQLALIGFLSCLLFYCLNLAVVSLCGRGAEARLIIFIVNIALPVLTFTLAALGQIYFYGSVTYVDFNNILTSGAVSHLSPLGMLVSAAASWLLIRMNPTEAYVLAPIRNLGWITAIIACIVYVAAAYLLMKKRHNERVGSPYVFKSIRHVVSAVTILAISSVAIIINVLTAGGEWTNTAYVRNTAIDLISLIPVFVLIFIVYIVMELISGNGFKKFPFTLLRYAGFTAGSVLICFLILNSGGLGAEYYVPDYNDIDAVVVTYGHGINMGETLRVDNAEEITKLHRSFVNDRVTNHSGIYEENHGYLGIDYRLKNGEIVSREYYDVDTAYIDDIARICIENGHGYVNEYKPIGDISDINDIMVFSYNMDDNTEIHADIPPEKLFEAMIKDAEKIDFNRIYLSNEKAFHAYIDVTWNEPIYGAGTRINNGYNGVGYRSNNYYIYSYFENTIKLLSDYGIEIPFDKDMEQYKAALVVKGEGGGFRSAYYTYGNEIGLFNPDMVNYDNVRIADIDEELIELYNHSGNVIYMGDSEEDSYCVVLLRYYEKEKMWDVSGCFGIVLPEYAEKAEAYWNSLPPAEKEAIDVFLNREAPDTPY